jgi:hypothetical protein
LNDYLWGAAHFKGIKIDEEKYKNNVHKITENGIWYKFKGEEDLEKFKNMSALSATTPGRWCTGSDMMARDYLIDRDSTMYIFYDTKYTNNVSLQVAVYNSNNTVHEIGGTLKGQDLTDQENNEFDSFLNNNKDIDAGDFQNYIDYKKVLQKWVKNNKYIDSLNYDDWLKIHNGKRYYKDESNLLEILKNNIPISFYTTHYNVDEKYIHIGDINDYNANIINDKNIKLIVGNLSLYTNSTLIANSLEAVDGNISLNKGATLTVDSLKSVNYISLNEYATLTANSLKTVRNDISLYEDATLTANLLETVDYIYLRGGSTLTANLLETVTGGIKIVKGSTLTVDSLKSVKGDIYLDGGAALTVNLLETVGNIVLSKYATLTVDSLEVVTGLIDIGEGSTLTANSLETVSSRITLYGDAKIIVGSKVYNSSNIDELKSKILSNNNTLYQGNKAAILKTKNTNYFIFGKDSNLTSAIHEKTHEYEDVLTEDEIEKLEKWSGYKKGSKAFSEAFAVGAERYIYEGYLADDEKLGGIFKRFVEWFKELIEDAISYFGSINELNDEVKEIYARMFIEQTVDKTASNTERKTNISESNENTLTNNTNSIAKLNGINSQKLYDIQDFLDGLDLNLTRETVLEDWIEGDYLIFPEKKLIEAYTNTQFDEFKRKIEFQHKEDSKPIENTQDNKTFIFEKIVNSLKENGLSEKTIVLSNNEYNKRQLALFGRQVSSAGFTYNGIIYLNKDKRLLKILNGISMLRTNIKMFTQKNLTLLKKLLFGCYLIIFMKRFLLMKKLL